jgi:hypothetical protein
MPPRDSTAAARRGQPAVPLAAAAILTLALAACSSGGSPSSQSSGTAPAATSSAPGTASPSASASGPVPPGVVAVTASGALVMLNPVTGITTATLVPSGVLPDEVAVAPGGGTIYFTANDACTPKIEAVPVGGGTPQVITTGSLPAISPDGTRLAYASEPNIEDPDCVPSGDPVPHYKLVVRTLSTGAQVSYPMVPAGQDSGLPAPISHLSWSPDNQHVAVSISSVEDNEGWNIELVDTATAKFYEYGAGVVNVPPTGQPTPVQSYLYQAVYLPDGNLFVSRACCAGVPPRNTSRLMWEVTPAGAFIRQVAVGFPSLTHQSLAVSPDGQWLLYVAAGQTGGGDLYISHDGATPRTLAHAMVAAAWI